MSRRPSGRLSATGSPRVSGIVALAGGALVLLIIEPVDMEVTSRRVRDDAHRFYAALGYEDQCRRSGRLKRALASPR